jgi:lipopolysaccharide export system permease protein
MLMLGYIIILNTGVVMAQKGKIPVILGVWTSNMLLSALTYITYKKKVRVM